MPYDLVIKNGMVVDGSGFSRYRADVAVTDGRIAEIGRIRGSARKTIDAEGLFVAPGIIDLQPRLIRPLNFAPGTPYSNCGTLQVGPQGCRVFVADDGTGGFIQNTGPFSIGDRV